VTDFSVLAEGMKVEPNQGYILETTIRGIYMATCGSTDNNA
jgi:hypothetical protein